MKPREEDLSGTIARLYEAAAGQCDWTRAIDGIIQPIGGAAGVIFLMDQETGQVVSWHGLCVEPDGSEYGRRLHAINPRAQKALLDPPGTLIWDYRCITEEEIDGHEFYDGINRLSGVRYFIGTYFRHDHGRTLFTSIERTKKQGHVDENDIALYAQIAPHISNAVGLASKLAATKKDASLFHLLDQKQEEGLALISRAGLVIETNSEADRVLAERDGLAVVDYELRTWKASDTRSLRRLLAAAIETTCGHGTASGGALSLPRLSGALSYVLRVVPWPTVADAHDEQVVAAVFIADPEHKGRVEHADLSACFGLSAREAQLAAQMATGESLRAASSGMGISHNTARVHLQHIFEKTGVANQRHLLRLLMSVP